MKNKKGSGTATSFLISVIVAFTIMVSVGILISDLTKSYDKTSIIYFEGYEGNLTEINQIAGSLVSDYDGDVPTEEGFFKSLQTRFEDTLFYKAFRSIKNVGKSIININAGIKKVSIDLSIPPIFTNLVLIIFGIVVIALIIKVIRGYSEI